MVDAFGPEFSIFLYVSRRPNIFSIRIPRRIQYTSKTSRRRNQDASKGWIIWRCWSDFSSSGGCCIGVGRFWDDFPVIAKISPRRFKMARDVAKTPQSASRPRFCLNGFGKCLEQSGKILGGFCGNSAFGQDLYLDAVQLESNFRLIFNRFCFNRIMQEL